MPWGVYVAAGVDGTSIGRGSGDGRLVGSAARMGSLALAAFVASFEDELPMDSADLSVGRSCGAAALCSGRGCDSCGCGGWIAEALFKVSSALRLEELDVVAVALVKLAAWDGLAVALVPDNELL